MTARRCKSVVRWSGASMAAALLSSSAAAQVSGVVLLLDREAARTSGRAVEVVQAQVMRIHRVVPASETVALASRQPACESDAGRSSIIGGVRAGTDLFFERTDLSGAAQVLGEAVSAFLDQPCVLRGDEAALREVCAGAVLLVRLHLLAGRMREAEDLARRVASVFPAGMVEATNEPPEVLALVSGARGPGREVEVVVTPAARAAQARLLVNGVPAAGEGPWRVRLPSGTRPEVAVMTPSGAVHVWQGDGGGPLLRLDLDLGDRVTPGPRETLQLAEGVDPKAEGMATARRLTEVAGRTVLFARAGDDGWLRVEEVAPGQDATRELLRLKAQSEPQSDIEVVVEPGGPLLSRPAWPWPYVAAGAAAALLGAGIYLNVAANQDADAVNQRGENRAGDYRTHRRWAIACYALSGASAAASVVLFLVRPEPKDRFIVFGTPAERGGFLSLGGRF